jgi:hypothetical protein
MLRTHKLKVVYYFYWYNNLLALFSLSFYFAAYARVKVVHYLYCYNLYNLIMPHHGTGKHYGSWALFLFFPIFYFYVIENNLVQCTDELMTSSGQTRHHQTNATCVTLVRCPPLHPKPIPPRLYVQSLSVRSCLSDLVRSHQPRKQAGPVRSCQSDLISYSARAGLPIRSQSVPGLLPPTLGESCTRLSCT